MSIILKGQASWYTAQDKGGNANVAMMSARNCPECGGTGKSYEPQWNDGYVVFGKCKRCGGDGILTNQMPFNPQGMECAMPLSLIEKHGLRFGQLVKVTYNKFPDDIESKTLHNKSITVRLVDIGPNEKLCAEGRIIDLTPFAFEQLEDKSKGLIDIEMEIL